MPTNPQAYVDTLYPGMLRELRVLWVMIEPANEEEEQKQPTAETRKHSLHRHTENGVGGGRVYSSGRVPGKGGGAWPHTNFARTRSKESANWGPIISP